MSSVLVKVCRLESVNPHPNAERLEIAVVHGWQCVVPKGKYAADSLVTYIPPNCVLPVELSERLGVTKYLSNGRVRSAKLRGEVSHGIVADPMGDEGDNVAGTLGITKWEPPIRFAVGDAEPQHPLFVRYTDIENMRHYPTLIGGSERVIVTEKIHGTNGRVGLIRDEAGTLHRMCGSKTIQRKDVENGVYSTPFRTPGVVEMMTAIAEATNAAQVMVFGEIYGKVQGLRYGLPNGLAFRVFDIMVNGNYLGHDRMIELCKSNGVDTVPVLYDGPIELGGIIEMSRGRSVVPGADNIREGVVVKPATERHDPEIGRVILKYVSDDYLVGHDEDEGE